MSKALHCKADGKSILKKMSDTEDLCQSCCLQGQGRGHYYRRVRKRQENESGGAYKQFFQRPETDAVRRRKESGKTIQGIRENGQRDAGKLQKEI